jgi:hypothetical protein
MNGGITRALIEQSFSTARGLFSGALVDVRHGGNVYRGIGGSIESSDQPGNMASFQGAAGSVRLLASEIKEPGIGPSDLIEVRRIGADAWKEYRVIMPRYDQTGATVRLDYEERN